MDAQTNDFFTLHVFKKGFGHLANHELSCSDFKVLEEKEDWIAARRPTLRDQTLNLCFPVFTLINPLELQAATVNLQADMLVTHFGQLIENRKITQKFPIQFLCSESVDGLSKRTNAVEDEFYKKLQKRFSRISKLIDKPAHFPARLENGYFIFFKNYNDLSISDQCVYGGQHRVKNDPAAPTRSFLKIEEAYGILNRWPKKGETVIDLGASPGGWSYSAAKHGANVYAIDRGPLKGASKNNRLIKHLHEDAFTFRPKERCHWLFSDIVANPYTVLELTFDWLAARLCQRFIINLKLGQVDPLKFIERWAHEKERLEDLCSYFFIRQLYHDRDEITIMGEKI